MLTTILFTFTGTEEKENLRNMASLGKRPLYQMIDGVPCPMFNPDLLREALNYKPKAGDVFIATYPKCGTTWMQTVALYIFRKGRELENQGDFHRLCPFIDARGLKGIEEMPRPGAFKTHFPRTRIPYSPEAKYIYVLRNPKDCCVSMYHHVRVTHSIDYSQATFDDFFELFMAGEAICKDYFDHLMSWYPHLKDKNVFFTTYEDMQKDLKDIVLRLSSFLGQEYAETIVKDNSVLNNILRFSSFEYMRKNYTEYSGSTFRPEDSLIFVKDEDEEKFQVTAKNFHVRKGIVGDSANYFSKEQSERLSRKFAERTKGTEIYEMYKDRMGL